MTHLMRFSHTRPLAVLFLLISVSIACVFLLPGLKFDPSLEGLKVGDNAAVEAYDQALKTFGSDKINIVYIKDVDLFTPQKLALVEELAYSLGQVPGVVKAEHIFSVNNFETQDGALVTGPLVEWVPETQEEAEAVRNAALANPILVGNLVAASGQALAINLFIEPGHHDQAFFRDLALAIDDLLLPLTGQFQTIFQIGDPSLRYEIANMMVADQKKIIPLSVLVLLVTLALATRSFGCALLPMLTSGVSVLWVAGFMALTQIPVNILTVVVPSLILVVGSTEDVHLILEYEHGLARSGTRDGAINWMIDKMGIVVMVTALSTFLGFASICINDVVLLRQFGMTAAFGLFVNPLVTCLLTPVYLKFFGKSSIKLRLDHNPGRFLDPFLSFLTANKKAILILFLGITLVIGLFGFRLKIENDYIAMFRQGSPILQRLDTLTRDFPGTQTFFIHIRAGHENLFKSPENLTQIGDIQAYIRDSGQFDTTTAITDFLSLIHTKMTPDAPKGSLPDSRQRITQYLAFLEDDLVSQYVSNDFSQVNIMVRHNLNSSADLHNALLGLEAAVRSRLNPHFKFSFTGDSILTLKGADAIADSQVKSILLLLFIILLVMSILFTNIKAGLLALIPNVIPVLVNFGIMGLLDIPLNVGTAMVAVIAVGIAVDDTLHFMTRYNDEMHQVKDQEQAMQICLRSEFRVVAATSFSLSMGFGVLCLSQFVPIVQFGLLSALVICSAFLCDVLVTPVLLSATRLLTMWDILTLKLRKDVIERSEFFRDMSLWQIKKVVLLSRMITAQKGEILYQENQADKSGDQSMFLLLEGQVRRFQRQSDTGKEIPVGFYAPGDIFGYIAMLNNTPRSASTRAVSDVRYVEINAQSLNRLKKMYPRIWGSVYRNLARILGDQLVVWQGVYSESGGRI